MKTTNDPFRNLKNVSPKYTMHTCDTTSEISQLLTKYIQANMAFGSVS